MRLRGCTGSPSGAFADRLCDKYHNLMSWLKCVQECTLMYIGSENSDLSYFETASQCAAGENQSHDILTEAFDRSNKKKFLLFS